MLILKVTVILITAWVVCFMLRRSSAAARQLIWTLGLTAVLLLPVMAVSVPPVRPRISPAVSAIPMSLISAPPLVAAEAAAGPGFPWRRVIWGIYCMGAALVLARVVIGSARIARIARNSEIFPGASSPVRMTGGLTLPVTWGFFTPVILLPRAAQEWPPERLRLVIAHEMAHIRRWDFLGQVAAQLACAIYWFHPLAWWAFRQLIKEREQACDDEVLNMGVKGTEYAHHLLQIIRSTRQESSVFSPALGMAQGSSFEQRLKSMLDPGVNRHTPSRRICVSSAILVAALLIPVAALRLPSQTTTASIQGVVHDPSGAVIPKARIFANNIESGNIDGAVSGPDGNFRIEGMRPGQYKIEVRAPGFALYQQPVIALMAGNTTTVDAGMNLGSVSESLEVVGRRTTAKAQVTPQRIRVGGNVQASKLLTQVPPVYPEPALQKGLEGTVLLRAVIGLDGRLLSLASASPSSDPDLTRAALDAVQQWIYEPTLLNGQPVEVTTTIAVTFRLQ